MNILFFLLFSYVNANYFIQITDVHLDLLYSPNSPNNCILGNIGLGCCRKDDLPKKPYKNASIWGDYNCDDSLKLANETLHYISNMNLDLDFIFFTGDIVDHHFFSETPDRNLNTMKQFYDLMKYHFKDIKVYPCLGNHDTWPLDQLAPPSVFNHFIMNFITDEWDEWLDSSALKTVKYGGYYTTLINDKFRLISINSLYYDNNNILIDNNTDVANQFVWLNTILTFAVENNETVWLIGHIPPTSGEANDFLEILLQIL